MSQKIVLGLDAKLYRNTGTFAVPIFTEIKNVRDLTLNTTQNEADVTTRAAEGWRQMVGVLKEASVEFEMVWLPADPNFTAIRDAYLFNTTIEFFVLDGDVTVTGSQGLRAEMSVLSFTRNEALEEALKVSVTIKPTHSDNAPVWFFAP